MFNTRRLTVSDLWADLANMYTNKCGHMCQYVHKFTASGIFVHKFEVNAKFSRNWQSNFLQAFRYWKNNRHPEIYTYTGYSQVMVGFQIAISKQQNMSRVWNNISIEEQFLNIVLCSQFLQDLLIALFAAVRCALPWLPCWQPDDPIFQLLSYCGFFNPTRLQNCCFCFNYLEKWYHRT